jgi:hypothetical protein
MSKKTIAVYGDSFANYRSESYGMGKSWVNFLEDRYEVTNFGEPGNSVYQCYETIKSHHEKYDYNIFLIPVRQRFFSNKLYNLSESIPFKNWFNNVSSLEIFKILIEKNKQSYNDADRLLKIIDSVYTYWTEWKDHDVDTTMTNLMLNDIKKINNIILIDTQSHAGEEGLTSVSIWEIDQLGFSEKYPANFTTIDENKSLTLFDLRKNHLSEENSFILYEKILDAINESISEIKLNHTDFVKPSEDLDFYVGWERYE